MEIKKIGQIIFGQDGAIYNGYLFRFDAKGNCSVYRTDELSQKSIPVSQFLLDKSEVIVPHCNSVVFGNARYNENDEFPLLYCNIYNNYANADNKKKGITCVYRLQRNEAAFSTTLVQLIEIGFVEDPLWKSKNGCDVRPYGNFVVDTENSLLYAFTMRDEEKNTRYFSFKLPDVNSGKYDDAFDAKRVILQKEDVIDSFDCEYHKYVQGACLHKGIIYSLEGFANNKENPPAIRLIDAKQNKQKEVFYFSDFGLTNEPELIDFEDDTCYYSDGHGNIYRLIF